MATSPPAGSPPISHLSTAKRRPSLGTPPTNQKRRKISQAGPSHLRQTSFPPENIPGQGSRSPSVDSSIAATPSVLSAGPQKRKGKGAKDDGSLIGSAVGSQAGKAKSAVNGGGSTVNGVGGDDEAEADDDEIDEVGAMVEGGKMSEAALKQEREHLDMLLDAFTPEQQDRYDTWRRVKLRKETVRKLTNHTLSQSVPASIITTINGYTKVLISELVERARDVQLEWQAAGLEVPDSQAGKEEVPLKDRLKPEYRGPLSPDHVREAFRRYAKDREGGCAGLLGLSLHGRESTASRMGGRKLFR